MKSIKSLPSADRLQELLVYDSETGIFTWKQQRPGKGGGKGCTRKGRVGTPCQKGYLSAWIDGKFYKLHRIAWKLTHGSDPECLIDHADGNKANNAISNLRKATNGENRSNTGAPVTNTSGIKGVDFVKRSGKWRAQVAFKGKKYTKETFATKEAAAEYVKALRETLHKEFHRHA